MTEIEIKGQKYRIRDIDTQNMYWVCPDGTKIPMPPSDIVESKGELTNS